MKRICLALVVGALFSTGVFADTLNDLEKTAEVGGRSCKDKPLFSFLRPKKEWLKVENLIAENVHSKCDGKKQCLGTASDVGQTKGAPSRSNHYTDPDDSDCTGANNRQVWYYDHGDKTEVYVFVVIANQPFDLIDDYVTSTVKFEAKADRLIVNK